MKRFAMIFVVFRLHLAACGRESDPTTIPTTQCPEPAVITENRLGTVDGYDYELWKDRGTTDMTLTGGGTFTCNWKRN